MGHVLTIAFHGNQVVGLEDERGVFVALKPIVEGMGLDWSAQYRRATRDPILSGGIAIMAMPLGQEQVFINLDLLTGWLFGISSGAIKDEDKRQAVLTYQRECYRVLARAFAKPAAAAVEPIPARPIDTVGQDAARKLVTETRHLFGELAGRQLWFCLGLPTVPAMYGAPAQLPLFTYDAHPARGGAA